MIRIRLQTQNAPFTMVNVELKYTVLLLLVIMLLLRPVWHVDDVKRERRREKCGERK